MKKNFIKKTLASTLAFAMVATVAPIAPASAAKAPALNKTGKILYLNENEVGNTFNFNVVNQVKGSTYKWTSADKTIATVNTKTGVVTAKKVGNVKIKCKITLPTKKTKTLTATVAVKENAVSSKIYNPTETVKINEEYNFNKSFKTASGGKCTDLQNWVIDKDSNTAGATVNAANGKVTATKAGSFKIKVQAYQSKTKLAAGDVVESDWLTVKVNPSVLSVAQTATSKVTVTFDDNMKEKVKAENFAIKNKATSVVSAVKGISFSDDGKVVTVETFAQYADGATYVLSYGDKGYEFATTIGDVTTVQITTTTVVEGKETTIGYVLRNANGIDITDAKSSTVTIEQIENNNGYVNGDKITIFEKGKTAKIKVTYHTYNYSSTGTEVGAVSAEAVITAVDETAAAVGNYKNYVITDSTSVNWSKVTANSNVICVGEAKNLLLNALDSNGSTVKDLTFESGNEDILLVSTVGDYAKLVAVKEGSTVVVVKNVKGTVLWTLPVVIKAERTATSISLAKSSASLVAGSEITTDSIEVKVLDQHGDSMKSTGKFDAPVAVATYTNAPTVVIDPANSNNVLVSVTGTTKAGTYQYKVGLTNTSRMTVLTVVVNANPGTAISSHKLQLSALSVDNVVDADTTESKSVNVKVIGYASGLPVQYSKCTIVVTGPTGFTTQTYTNVSGFNFEYVTVTGGTITKLGKGVYTITAKDGDTVIAKNVINVTDTQVAPTVTVNKNTYAGTIDKNTVLAAAVANCTVKSSLGTELKPENGEGISAVDYTTVTGGTQVYIKTVTIKERFGKNVFEHVVAIGKTITIK